MTEKVELLAVKVRTNQFNRTMIKKNTGQDAFDSSIDNNGEISARNSDLNCELSDSGVLIIRPQGPLRKEDFDQVANLVDPWIKAHSMLQGVVICMQHFPGWEDFGSFIHHLDFVESHQRKVKRVALAVDGVLPMLISKFSSHFVNAEIKQFPFDHETEALQWVSGKN